MSTIFFDLPEKLEATPGLTVTSDVLPDYPDERGFRIDASPAGGVLYFRGPAGRVGGVEWRIDHRLIFPVYQDTLHSLFLRFLFWEGEPGDAAPHADIAMGVFPGFTVQVVLPLRALDLGTLFLPRTPGRLKNVSVGTPVDPDRVTCLALVIPPSAGPQTIWFGTPRLSDREPAYSVPARPVVDEMGQWMRKTWPGKTRDPAELTADLRRQAGEPAPSVDGSFDEYGGWTARRLQPTGFFRTEHDGRRWWLVDPAGHPFFSVGPDCVGPHSPGPVAGLEPLFSWLPPREGDFADAWLPPYRENTAPQFSFPVANLIRAFGRDWQRAWETMVGKRLRAWGFNTIGNWSVPGLGRRLRLPYVYELHRFPTTARRIFRDFPDVFSPDYAADAEKCVRQLAETADDPYLVGYFLRNEPHWGFGDYNLASFLLAHPERLASKERLVRFLAERYAGDVAALSSAWGLPGLSSFEDLLGRGRGTDGFSPAAEADLRIFTAAMIDEYVRVPAEAARRVDPNHLNLGLRWAWVASDAFYAGSRYCDIFSINCYKLNPDAAEIDRHARATGLPLIIGEFHAGALDVGLPSNGLRGMADQRERGRFYQWYVERAAALPALVGAHYFQWCDQPVLGRDDGENCNIGLVDVCHRPYTELVRAAAETHRRLYGICAGNVPPVDARPAEVPREGF